MNLEIHSQARSHFNKTGLSLVSSCKEGDPRQQIQNAFQFPDGYISANISDKDITGEIETSDRGISGERVARYFIHQGKEVGLAKEDYQQFIKLCESIQRAIKPPSTVSCTAVEDQVFTWIRDRFRDDTDAELADFVLPRLEADISELEVWVPIAQLRVESNIHIGNIWIRPISEEIINQWRDDLLVRFPDNEKQNITQLFDVQLKKQLQGWSASVIKIFAEPIAAKEIALHETERSLAMLRMFSNAALTPRVSCYSAVMGRENIESFTAFVFKDELFVSQEKAPIDRGRRHWNLDNGYFSEIQNAGLNILSELLQEKNLTKFQDNILDSVTLYSQATREKELSNKLVYLLASLEGTFLKNDTESIQQNLSERIATLIGKNLKEKKDIIKNVKAIYSLRSAFLHHAHTINDYRELELFMHNAWRAMIIVIENHNRFTKKQDFVSAIDDLKLSPQ